MVGVVVPPVLAGAVADAVRAYVTAQLLAERGRRADGSPAFAAAPLLGLVRALGVSARLLEVDGGEAAVSVGVQSGFPDRLVSLNDWCARTETPRQTARRWARAGSLVGAARVGGRWLVPADAPDPRGTAEGVRR